VGIPGPPGADLVVIQPGLTLGLLEAFLYVPAAPGDRRCWTCVARSRRSRRSRPGRWIDRRASSQCPRPRRPSGRAGIRDQSNSRGPCAPAPVESRCQARGGAAAISASAPRVVASPEQVRELLAAATYVGPRCGGRMVAFFACLYFAMLRPSEAAALRKDDCHLPATGWGRLDLADTTCGRQVLDRQWAGPRATRAQEQAPQSHAPGTDTS